MSEFQPDIQHSRFTPTGGPAPVFDPYSQYLLPSELDDAVNGLIANDSAKTKVALNTAYVGISNPGTKAKQSIQTTDAIALRYFRAALANRGAARCDIMHIGDSITWGHKYSADGVPSIAGRWGSIVRDTLRNRFPVSGVTGGLGFISVNQTFSQTMSDSPITTSGGSDSTTYGLDRHARILNGAGASITVTFTGTGLDIGYVKYNGGGTFSYAVDGGAATNVATSNTALANNNQVQIRGLAAGSHTVVVSYVSGGSSFIGGFYAYNGDESKGIGSWVVAWPGVMTSYWSDAPNWADSLPWATPDLVTIELGANDFNQSNYVDSATYKTKLQALISKVKTSLGYMPSFVLVPVWELAKSGNPETWQAYVDVMYDVAASDADGSVCVFDARQRVNPGPNGTIANGILGASDKAHLTDLGNRYVGESLAQFLAPQ